MKKDEKGEWYPEVINFNTEEQKKSDSIKKENEDSLQKRIDINLYK